MIGLNADKEVATTYSSMDGATYITMYVPIYMITQYLLG
jgi:hypothetical protein